MSLLDYFTSRVAWNGDEDECWTWEGSRDARDYGQFWDGSRLLRAHRWAYEQFVGPIPGELELDHLCRRHECVNPAHLEAVTHAENVRRGESGRKNRSKTHCLKGHPFSGDNLVVDREGKRKCRECDRERARLYQRRKYQPRKAA